VLDRIRDPDLADVVQERAGQQRLQLRARQAECLADASCVVGDPIVMGVGFGVALANRSAEDVWMRTGGIALSFSAVYSRFGTRLDDVLRAPQHLADAFFVPIPDEKKKAIRRWPQSLKCWRARDDETGHWLEVISVT
jgi:hypothetical protein